MYKSSPSKLSPHSKGFTLIELLVVIAIIGLLASVMLVALNKSRIKSRDAKRKADLAQLAKAIELYRNDNGQVPIPGGWCTQISHPVYTQFRDALVPTYLAKLPQDPLYADSAQDYFYNSTGGGNYILAAMLEDETINSYNEGGCHDYPGTTSTRSTNYTYSIRP